jgi:uncharacterized membrane protein
MNALRAASLIAATLTMGLVTGAFVLYQHTIMPGLGKTDDKTFVGAFQSMDRAIINPWFMIFGFVGALVFTILAGVVQLGRKPLPWIAIAFVLYLVVFIMTIAINVPLNDALKAAGDPNTIDVAAAREAFNEARWTASNLVRSLLSTGAFALLAWALVVQGKSSA